MSPFKRSYTIEFLILFILGGIIGCCGYPNQQAYLLAENEEKMNLWISSYPSNGEQENLD